MAGVDKVLSVDVGGTTIKFGVVDVGGALVSSGFVATGRPCSPHSLLEQLDDIVSSNPAATLVVGFPGGVVDGRVVSAYQFWREGGVEIAALRDAWTGFDLATVASARWHTPTIVVNDAVLHGAAVVSGRGVELVITL